MLYFSKKSRSALMGINRNENKSCNLKCTLCDVLRAEYSHGGQYQRRPANYARDIIVLQNIYANTAALCVRSL